MFIEDETKFKIHPLVCYPNNSAQCIYRIYISPNDLFERIQIIYTVMHLPCNCIQQLRIDTFFSMPENRNLILV